MPSAPAQIKAVLSAPNKILVSWMSPKFSNGPLIGYTFYMSVVEDGQEEGTHKRTLGPTVEMYEVTRAQETVTLQFWVTASTRVRNYSCIFVGVYKLEIVPDAQIFWSGNFSEKKL